MAEMRGRWREAAGGCTHVNVLSNAESTHVCSKVAGSLCSERGEGSS